MNPRSTAWLRPGTRIVLVTALPALVGCSIPDDGPRVTQAREVAPFVRVVNDSSVVLRLRAGEPRRARVRAGAEVVDDVRTDVRDGTLHITFVDEGLGDSDVALDLSVPELAGIASQGSGDISATGIDTERFDVYSDGSADVAVTGAAGRLRIRSDGSGAVDLKDLAAREVDLSTDGSGDVEVRADERLDVRLDGSGDVRYLGDPRLGWIDDGSGEIERLS